MNNTSLVDKKQRKRTKNGTLSQEVDNREIRQVVFFRLASGREPVREWLRKLDRSSRKTVGEDLFTLQQGWPVGMPLARKIETDLWEQRSKIVNGITRILFTESAGHLILLHGFIKKSQKLPVTDLTLARQRLTTVGKGRKL